MKRLRLHVPSYQYKYKGGLVFMVLTALLLGLQPSAITYANQSPALCNSNRFNISIIKNRTEVYEGQILTYTVTANNVNFNTDIACDITAAAIDITLPAADGTPTGTTVNLVTNQDFPAGTTTTIVGSTDYTVHVNPGVTDLVAKASATGVLHDAPVDHSAQIIKTIGTTVVTAPTSGGSGGTSGGSGSSGSTTLPKLPNTGSRP